MTGKEELISVCTERLKHLGLYDSATYRDRLHLELRDIFGKGEADYFLATSKECREKNLRYHNEHNTLVPRLLDICREVDIDKPPAFDYGEFPDIDIDYIDGVREYLKDDFAKKTFGEDYVCNIANYNTAGIRLAMKDMARVFGKDHEEVEEATKKLKEKDEDGNVLTWEQSLETFKEFREYCERHPDVADAASRMVGRIRGQGQHASGLVVSRVPIKQFIPLVRGTGGQPASAWIEGLHGSDLSTVGFVKFDFLGLDGNQKIATACKLACQDKPNWSRLSRTMEDALHVDGDPLMPQTAVDIIDMAVGGMTVCALPGTQENGEPWPSWSDTRYLDDKKALGMAHRGDLRMVFQFDGSPGIRRMARDGGVDRFDDLVAYTAMYRPGPMKLGAHEQYIKRKRGKEEWTVHPALASGPANLSFTYGVLCYQEQVMRMLNTVGQIPLGDCEAVRKAISKKKIEKFQKYKDMFVANGQETLGAAVDELFHMWDLIEAFAGYGFNLSHAVGYTYISSRMLWLKAHLPLQFFASMFTHTKASGPSDYQKLREYKQEAARVKWTDPKTGVEHTGFEIMPVDVNKSKVIFTVQDNKVHYGFCKVKEVGEKAAQRIQDMQPYAGFEDFLHRFGTEAKPVQAMLALGCFKAEGDALRLYKFYEHFKKFQKGEADRLKRFENQKAKLLGEIAAASDPDEVAALQKKLERSVANKEKKDQFLEVPTLAGFNAEEFTLKDEDEDFLKMLANPGGDEAQLAYYGYLLTHPLEKCPGYEGLNIREFVDSDEKDGHIEVVIKEVNAKKGPKATYYSLSVEDAAGDFRRVTVWEDDFHRFEEELKPGAMARLHVDTPQKQYMSLTLHQFPGGRYRRPRREQDHRVAILG
jgi:DNA polymerase III alpha subunit